MNTHHRHDRTQTTNPRSRRQPIPTTSSQGSQVSWPHPSSRAPRCPGHQNGTWDRTWFDQVTRCIFAGNSNSCLIGCSFQRLAPLASGSCTTVYAALGRWRVEGGCTSSFQGLRWPSNFLSELVFRSKFFCLLDACTTSNDRDLSFHPTTPTACSGWQVRR